MSQIPEVGDKELDSILGSESRGVLIDFWSPWCGKCLALRPQIEKLAVEFAKRWQVVAVDAEAQRDVADRYGVSALPTFVFLKNGVEYKRMSGMTLPSTIATQMEELG